MTRGDSLEFCLDASLENLGDFRDYVDRAGNKLGLEPALLGDLRLVVDEAVTNIVLHGYDGAGGPVGIQLDRDGKQLVVRIRDEAPAFNPDAVHDPELQTALSERQPGGMGIFLMRRMMDGVEFCPLPAGGNELRMVKNLD